MTRLLHNRSNQTLAALLAFALLAACAAPTGNVATTTAEADAGHNIYVVRHGWHTGVVVPAAQVPRDAWPARSDLLHAEYLEVGWGDRDFYQAPKPGVWLGVRALFWPTPGALHIVGLRGPVETFPGAEIVALRVSAAGLARLIASVRESHQFDAAGRGIVLGPALYGEGHFYASRESFHMVKTCNVWTAARLHEAGVPVGTALTAGSLLAQLRPYARVIRGP